MAGSDSQIIIEILRTIDKKREEIKTLTSKILELKEDIDNKVEITQLMNKILSNVYSAYTPNSDLTRLQCLNIIQGIESLSRQEKRFEVHNWNHSIVPQIVRFCMEASEWNPIDLDLVAKGSKTIININLPKNINLGNIIGRQTTS
jgi:hypothetical protein